MFDYLIIGAGLAGSVVAEQVASQLGKKVLLVEKRRHIGGNCYDYRDKNNIIVHKYGPHLLHTNSREVFDYLSRFTEWTTYQHYVLAFIDGKRVPIPFNLNTIGELFPPSLARRLEEKLLSTFDYNAKVPILELKQTTDSDLKFLADYVYEKVFVNYTAKQWGVKPEEIDSAVTARVPVFIGRDDRYFNDRYQVVPRHGYTRIFKNMLNHPNIKLMLNTDFRDICQLSDNGFRLFDQPFAGKVVFTGMIDELFDFRFGQLPYRSINMCFETIDNEYFQEVPVVNYPNDYDFTRITEFKYIHRIKSPKTTILTEYPVVYERDKNIPYYPLFTLEQQKKYSRYKDYAKQWPNLIMFGRLAEYKYYDMDDIVEKALTLVEELIK